MATQGSVKQSLRKAAPSSSEAVIEREALALRSWAKQCALVYRPAVQAGLLTPGLLSTWQEEIVLELDLMEQEETQARSLREEIQGLGIVSFTQVNLAVGLTAKLQPCFKYVSPNYKNFPVSVLLPILLGITLIGEVQGDVRH